MCCPGGYGQGAGTELFAEPTTVGVTHWMCKEKQCVKKSECAEPDDTVCNWHGDDGGGEPMVCCPSLITTTPAPACFEENMGYEGDDVALKRKFAASTPTDCQRKCQYIKECKWWTHIHGKNIDNCKLKTAKGTGKSEPGHVSGPQYCPTPPPPPKYSTKVLKNYPMDTDGKGYGAGVVPEFSGPCDYMKQYHKSHRQSETRMVLKKFFKDSASDPPTCAQEVCIFTDDTQLLTGIIEEGIDCDNVLTEEEIKILNQQLRYVGAHLETHVHPQITALYDNFPRCKQMAKWKDVNNGELWQRDDYRDFLRDLVRDWGYIEPTGEARLSGNEERPVDFLRRPEEARWFYWNRGRYYKSQGYTASCFRELWDHSIGALHAWNPNCRDYNLPEQTKISTERITFKPKNKGGNKGWDFQDWIQPYTGVARNPRFRKNYATRPPLTETVNAATKDVPENVECFPALRSALAKIRPFTFGQIKWIITH